MHHFKSRFSATTLYLALMALSFSVVACSTVLPAETPAATEAEAALNTADVIAAGLWGDNVTITVGDGTFNFVSDGLPNHELPDVYLVPGDGNQPPFGDDDPSEFDVIAPADFFVETPLDVTITTNPVYSEEVTATTLGQIGIMISGAQMFNDYEDMEGTVALEDNITHFGASFIDPCNGHPLAPGHNYHYHGVPYCITDAVDVEGQHSTMIGVLLDGFPVYGNKDEAGAVITSDDLDECSGHFGATPEFPEGIYHYHLTEDRSPYSIDCFHGEIENYGRERRGEGGPPEGGEGGRPEGAPDFAGAAEQLGIDQDALRDALGGPPPDFEAAAETLGISVEDLQAALGAAP